MGKQRLSFLFSVDYFRDDDYAIYVTYGRLGKGNVAKDQIGLKFSVFSPNKTTYSMRNVAMDGVFLGSSWIHE